MTVMQVICTTRIDSLRPATLCFSALSGQSPILVIRLFQAQQSHLTPCRVVKQSKTVIKHSIGDHANDY